MISFVMWDEFHLLDWFRDERETHVGLVSIRGVMVGSLDVKSL